MKTAVIVDGAFFLKRFFELYKNKPDIDLTNPKDIINELQIICYKHLKDGKTQSELYRIFFYDCPPVLKKVHYPISHKPLDFSKGGEAQLRLAIHNQLKRTRKVALRLGRLQAISGWVIKKKVMEEILKGKSNIKSFTDLKDSDFVYDIKQKSVDMKIGIDIASLAYKKQVDKIVLIAGDADFVPAAKLARREGIDFVLDSMHQNIAPDLFEHIDGFKSYAYKSNNKNTKQT